MSQITTHVLDTATGKPAQGVRIELQKQNADKWDALADGITNEDGRITDLLKGSGHLEPGIYRMLFHTGEYFQKLRVKAFYPFVPIIFETFDTEHYHIPLLLNPFGYTTYRGS